jgi:3-phosphoshikimate 1-carboxyvinyltransferase
MSPSGGGAGTRAPAEVQVPGDKSLTHRALLLSALADGRSRIRAPLRSADTEATAACLRQLGCAVPALDEQGELIVDGVGLHGLRESLQPLDCGNSGTTARLLMGTLAGYAFPATLTGDASLCSRPMRRVTEPLGSMGARFAELGSPDRLPLRMHGGALRSLRYDSPHASAQVKSALLLAGLTGGVAVDVSEPLLSRDHTERMLLQLGVPLRTANEAGAGARVELTPVSRLEPLDFDVPGDFSSAAFVAAYACLAATDDVLVRDVGLNPTRTGLLHVLGRMGARVRVVNERLTCGEPVGDVRATRSTLKAVHITAAEVPSLVDEIPVIAILAARADGTTVIEGARELRVKESDRIAALVANLQLLGVAARELDDGMVIHGTDRPLTGRVRTAHDHRIAMAFGVLQATEGDRVTIDDPDVVNVSFPAFWDVLRQVQAR